MAAVAIDGVCLAYSALGYARIYPAATQWAQILLRQGNPAHTGCCAQGDTHRRKAARYIGHASPTPGNAALTPGNARERLGTRERLGNVWQTVSEILLHIKAKGTAHPRCSFLVICELLMFYLHLMHC